MLDLDPDFVEKLNLNYEGGKFIKTVILTETVSPLVQKFWVDHDYEISFNGNTYERLKMRWDGIKTSRLMPVEGATVTTSNLGNAAIKYVKQLDITGNEVLLQILHLDLLTNLTGHWLRKFKVQGVQADISVATFTVSRAFGHNKLPRKVFLKSEFKGLSSDVPRIF